MNNLNITISLDDAFDCYEMSKRNKSEIPLFCFDIEKKDFIKIKSSINDTKIMFINSYKLCSDIIDEYLNQPQMANFKNSFIQKNKNSKNKIVEFLWFFEHIDGCCDFKKYEILKVTKELKKWCKKNNINYSESEIYRID